MKTQFQEHQVEQIENGRSRMRVAPQFGARLLTWDIDGKPVLFWPDDADWSNLKSARGGNPILFPFVARHMVDGVIGRWQDEQGVVRELPMHGFARAMAFEIVPEAEPHTLRMRIGSTPETLRAYPFEFRFDVVYRLDGASLEARFETTNTGSEPMPYYAGHHFYLALPHDQRSEWTLNLSCEQFGRQNPDGSIAFEASSGAAFSLDDAALIDRFHVGPKAGQIILQHGGGRRIIFDLTSPTPWYDVTTWTQSPDSDFFCVEPWLGLPNAIHHGHGLRLLPPGQTEIATCRLTVEG